MNDNRDYVTQEQCEERRNKIAEDYENLKRRVGKHGEEIDGLNNESIRDNERIKTIENTLGIVSKIMITIAGAFGLLIIKGALGL